MQLDNETGNNVAEITFDMRTQSENNNSFIQIHQGTMVGMTLGLVVVIIIALVLYAFGRCWCWRIHRWCGEDGAQTNADMEMGRANSAKCVDNKTEETDDTEKPKKDSSFIIGV